MSAVRFAMFAERATDVLREAREIEAHPVAPLIRAKNFDAARALTKAKQAAAADIATFEPLLYPPD